MSDMSASLALRIMAESAEREKEEREQLIKDEILRVSDKIYFAAGEHLPRLVMSISPKVKNEVVEHFKNQGFQVESGLYLHVSHDGETRHDCLIDVGWDT